MINVLIVEDDPMVAALNKKYLEIIPGFRLVNIVNNGEAALEIIRTESISLIFLDLFMPKMNGLELLKAIRNDNPDIDVIMVTADKSAESIQTALRLGAIDYIVKPFTFERLQTSLALYIERHRLLSGAKEIEQQDLDNALFSQKNEKNKGLPKGIDAETLSKVIAVIEKHPSEFTISDLVPEISLSRISLKKYIDYLESSGQLNSHLVYSSVGRPARTYSYKI